MWKILICADLRYPERAPSYVRDQWVCTCYCSQQPLLETVPFGRGSPFEKPGQWNRDAFFLPSIMLDPTLESRHVDSSVA